MFAAFVFLLVAASVSGRGEFGACVEECSSDGHCPDGEVCASNGCGHTCQPGALGPSLTDKICSDVVCFMYCEFGWAKDEDGCDMCQCADGAVAALSETKCPGIMCMMFCEHGFQKGDDGCDICKCASVTAR